MSHSIKSAVLSLAVLACALFMSACIEHGQVSGVVYDDANLNGIKDATERGLAGVYLSNGDQFTVTDRFGKFNIFLEEEIPSWVALTQSDGYKSSDSFYRAEHVDDHSFDFGLQNDSESLDTEFSFIHGADIQYPENVANNIEQLRYDFDLMEHLSDELDSRFYTCVGDLTTSGGFHDLRLLKAEVDSLERPFYAAFGGHDGIAEMEFPNMGNYVEIFGPYSYSWNYGGVHFISLVSELEYLSEEEKNRQDNWLQNDLSLYGEEMPIIIITHVPGQISEKLARIAGSYNLIAVLQGHQHIHNLVTIDDVPVFNSGPWRSQDWGAFTRRVRVVTVEDGNLSSATRVMGQKKRVVIVSPLESSLSGSRPVVVNIYDTTLIPESASYQVYSANNEIHSGELIQRSDWTWVDTSMPELSPGSYRIVVTVFAGDERWSAERNFAIGGGSVESHPFQNWSDILGSNTGVRFADDDGLASSGQLELTWIATTGTTLPYFSSPIVAGGKVYLGLSDGQIGYKKAGVICVDAEKGYTLWRRALKGDILSSIASEDENIYVLSNEGELYCLDGSSGVTIWSSNVFADANLFNSGDYSFRMNMAPLVVEDGVVYVVTHGSILAAYDADRGRLIWNRIGDLYCPYQVAGLGVGNEVVVGVDEGKYAAFDIHDGTMLWQKKIEPQRGTSAPVFDDGYFYLNYEETLLKVDSKSGDAIWSITTAKSPNYMGIPAIADGKLIIAKGNTVGAVDKVSGEKLWTFFTRSPAKAEFGPYQILRNGSAPALSGEYIYVGGDDGYFYVLDMDTGAKMSEYHIGTPIKSSPAISGNMVFVSAFDGNIYAFTMH